MWNEFVKSHRSIQENDPFINRIAICQTFEKLNACFLEHSIQVFLDNEPCDVWNSCDGPKSPLERYVIALLEQPEQISLFLNSIQNETDYNLRKWIISELEYTFWKQPHKWLNVIEPWIRHPIIGPRFSMCGSVPLDYYEDEDEIKDDLDIQPCRTSKRELVATYIVILQLYKQLWKSQCYDYVVHQEDNMYQFVPTLVSWSYKKQCIIYGWNQRKLFEPNSMFRLAIPLFD